MSTSPSSRTELLQRRLRGLTKRREDGIAPVPRDGALPLSFAQHRMWVLDQLLPGGTEYLMPLLLRLPGPVDPVALRRALDALVARHEVLRTRHPAVDDEPLLVIDPPGPIALTTVDLCSEEPEQAERRLAELVAGDGARPLDLATEHPVRALLARLPDGGCALLLTVHHIASDGWSEGVLLGELDRLYRAFAADLPDPLDPPGVQYLDFAAWQRTHLSGDRLAGQLAYWRTTLADLAPLALPTDRPRGPVRDSAGATARFTVPAELASQITELGRSRGATPFMAFLAAFQLLLGRLCGQTDVVVGTPVAGREGADTQAMVGLFANTVALRTDLSGDPSFLELLGRVRETALGAFTHQETPFERLVDELAPERDPSRNPIFQVVFQLAAYTPAEPGALRAEQQPVDWRTAKFDLGLALAGTADGSVTGQLEYASALFDAATIERTIGHYLRLLAGIAADPGRPVNRLDLLSDAERELLASWSGSGRDYRAEETIPEVFQEWAARTPDAVAVTCDGVALTYAELNSRANRLAHRLMALGAGPEALVGVRFERGPELVVALLAVLKSGAGYLPLDPGQPAERLSYILADAQVACLVTDRRGEEEAVTTLLPDEDDQDWPDTDPAPRASCGNTAYVIHTSGSTGAPKGVPVSHANVLRLLRSCQEEFGFGPEDVWTLFHSYAFDFSVWELWGALLNGGRAVVVPFALSRSPQDFLDLLVSERVTVLNQTPSAFRGLQEAVALADPFPHALALRTVVFGGEALDVAELAPWFDRFGDQRPTLVNMYGITETTVHVTHRRVRAEEAGGDRRSPIGRPLGDLRLHLLDADLNLVPIGVPGQLYVSGPGVARGYLRRPGLTAERFLPDPYAVVPGARVYRTGDLARYGADGELEFLGRADDQVKIRGHRIEPGEIEAAIGGLPDVDKSLVVAHRRAGERESRLVAYVAPRASRTLDVSGLRTALGRTLPGYMVPAVFVPLDAFPMTANGKIDRRALPDPDTHRALGGPGHLAPRTSTERIVAETWTEVLGMPRVGALDNFFDLGGDSIRAIKVVGALRRRGTDLTVQNLLVHQTVEELARFADTVKPGGPTSVEEQRVAPFTLLSEADRAALPPGLTDAYPLAMVQAAMVYQMLADRDESPYHNITLFPFVDDAPFSLPAMREAAALLARRHEIVRTSFDLDGYSEPLQLVHADATVEVGYDDLRGLDAERIRTELEEFTTRTRRTPFDIGRAPMLRFHVHLTADDRWTFSFIECHAILDGWSHHSLIDEVMRDYRAIRDGRAPAGVPGHTVRYADHIALERRSLADAEDRAHWQRQVADFERVVLPPSWAADPSAGERPYHVTVAFRDLEPGLRRLASTAGVPLKSVLFAAHLKAMATITGSRRFHSGLVFNGRLETAGGELVRGMHLNTVPLGVELTGGTWRELAGQVFAAEVAAWPHRRFPLPEMQRAWGDGTPLVEVSFTYLDFHVLDNRQIESGKVVDVSPNEFALDAWTFPGVFFLAGRPEWISRANGRRLAGLYRRILEEMAADPLGDAEADLLGAEERGRLLDLATGAEAACPDVCVHELFEQQAARTPDAVALHCADGSTVDFAALNARANRIARRLRALGVGPESRVGVLLRRGPDLVAALLAVLKAGGAYLPLDPAHPAQRLTALLADTDAVAVLTQQDLADLVSGHPGEAVLLDRDPGLDALDQGDLCPTAAPGNLAYVVYTSGSTGAPKGVMIEHRSLVNYLTWTVAEFPPVHGTGSPLYSAMTFDLPVTSLFPALVSGQPVTLTVDDGTPGLDGLVAALERGGFGLVKLTPTHLALLNQTLSPGALASATDRLVIGGEALTREMLSTWAEHAPATAVVNHYGPTEATVGCAFLKAGADTLPPGPVPIGRPAANTVMRILDRDLRLVPAGVIGELYIGGAQLARGYVERPGLTADRFVPDPYAAVPGARLYRTGDLARYREDGLLEYRGRADDQVKIRGYRIEPGEVEGVLRRHPAVREVSVRVRTAPGGEHSLAAYVVPRDGAAVGPAELRDWLLGTLPAYLVPSGFALLDALPLTPSGKVDPHALPEPDTGSRPATQYLAPRTAVEGVLAAALAEVLGLPRVGVDDSFTDLGGNSLTAMRVIVRLREDHGIAVAFRDFYQHRTVADLARAIDPAVAADLVPAPAADPARATDGFADPVLWLRREGGRPPLFCVYPGGAQWYVHLAERLAEDRPVVGLEWPGLHLDVASPQSIGSVAEQFLGRIRAIRPTGPYHLLGWCGAGPVTSELAHRLHRDGEQLTFALLDPALDSHTRRNLWAEVAMFARGEDLLRKLDLAVGEEEIVLLQEEFLKVLDYVIDEGAKLVPSPGDTFWAGRLKAWRELAQATLGYRHRPYPGRMHLLIGDELAGGAHDVNSGQSYRDYLARWGELTPGGLEVHRVGGDHLGVLRPPHVAGLARLIDGLLAETD
ncbi:non-ribosomal peptide synthetase [Streptacidiphilus sp. P02-A3a]|uniref:non-ribosomal peptide synthetase n=1 Tax=Streptacidiphilus sp. P02-A3a TaxID=2704468 RepID=UPI0015FBFFBB|nr:non-ribosomal peptide synthetase [Streptacidiphilus sp. P02-A3a]QMU71794.1 amino acid adenylation domain-containing protein [Streptacidiphilus sp. P02-A3a]